ncbi:hypothetical protein AB1Y20_010979 [Prymnesium parvum]|uniref:Methyltransferase FkbM domain-containing protein n=1 Tax=Prymnesium parvum TaxID=97485 RepID=A0AB34IKG6_PRYPA
MPHRTTPTPDPSTRRILLHYRRPPPRPSDVSAAEWRAALRWRRASSAGACAPPRLAPLASCAANASARSGALLLPPLAAASWEAAAVACARRCRCARCAYLSISLSARRCVWSEWCGLTHAAEGEAYRTAPRRADGEATREVGRLPTEEWMRWVDARRATIVQVGAHDHRASRRAEDPAPLAVRLGWRALLLEPMPAPFAALQQRYAAEAAGGRVGLVRGGVCHRCGETGGSLWHVDLSNASGQWGSARADGRCAREAGLEWIAEIASLSRSHLRRHARLLAATPPQCAACAARWRRRLADDCLRDLIARNTAVHSIECVCLATLLRAHRIAAVDLLLIDAEGHDAAVLRHFPFASVRTSRVAFESLHLSAQAFAASAARLESLGFSQLSGGRAAFLSVWRHANASPPLAAAAAACAPFGVRPEEAMAAAGAARRGYCEGTRDGDEGDCAAGRKGSWPLSPAMCSAAACARRCREACGRCRFVSFSLAHQECSWFADCRVDALRLEAGGASYLTWDVSGGSNLSRGLLDG